MTLTYTHSESHNRTHTRVAHFQSGPAQLEECHICIEAPAVGNFSEQLAAVQATHQGVLAEHGLDENSTILRRVFLSDAANQVGALDASRLGRSDPAEPVAISVIEQSPLDGRKLSIWEYHVRNREPLRKQRTPNGITFAHAGRSHIWTCGMSSQGASGAFDQTEEVLRQYENELAPSGATLRDHAVRTWFYLSDIDAEYAALVEARKRHFRAIGLTRDTHFIASTGIAGRGSSTQQRILLDAYAVSRLTAEQVKYLSAPRYLGPTHLYGVTFERGTRVVYGDRAHVYLSGTASIDPEGNTLHVGDVLRQCRRAMENTEALLDDAGGGLSDVVQLIAYVRDPADGNVVASFLAQRCPEIPRIVVRAAVCRPNWLVEFECVALLDQRNPNLPEF